MLVDGARSEVDVEPETEVKSDATKCSSTRKRDIFNNTCLVVFQPAPEGSRCSAGTDALVDGARSEVDVEPETEVRKRCHEI